MAEVEPEARLKDGPDFRIERPSGGGSRGRYKRVLPQLLQCACFAASSTLGRTQNLVGDAIRLRFQWIVNWSNRELGLYFGARREIARRLLAAATMRRGRTLRCCSLPRRISGN
jgi:hypothetical protein